MNFPLAAGVAMFLSGALLAALFPAHVWTGVMRWTGLAVIAAAGYQRSTLTYWIFSSMLLGVEIGLDRPALAEHLRVFSDIFLRLIKVIVAPLIFGTLVTGIAGHGNLRSVGRIVLKSLIYFEVVTTIALFIGVAAINLTHAGEGLAIPQSGIAAPAQNAAPLHWDEFPVHMFPESVAKAVAENQILQVSVFAMLFGIALARVSENKRAPPLRFC
jgi:proton glutamate symport protein